MKLKELMVQTPYRCIHGDEDTVIGGISYDSRRAKEGDVFLCIVGEKTDGHEYIGEVLDKKIAALVVEKEKVLVPELRKRFGRTVVLAVPDTRYALAMMSAAYFDFPAKKLHLIGITGTKGKTTTAYMIRSILEEAGFRTGLIGTVETIVGMERAPVKNTTPESYVIHETLDKMVKAGCCYAVMEVSSQGLKMSRTAGITYDIGVFTNLSPDHISPLEHQSIEEYIQCKSKLFKQCKCGIVNIDDKKWTSVLADHTCMIETYGFGKGARVRGENLRIEKGKNYLGIRFSVKGEREFEAALPIPGKFNVYNGLAAISVGLYYGLSQETIQKGLSRVDVKGRMEIVGIKKDFVLMIDYAHNALSLENLLNTLREYEPERLICLFGCGGNRSKLRRYEMGETAGRLADYTILTSDNPRDESPEAILSDIREGIERTAGKYTVICDRKEAIKYALNYAAEGDIVVLAGKGHETYQEIGKMRYPLDERRIIAEIVGERLKK